MCTVLVQYINLLRTSYSIQYVERGPCVSTYSYNEKMWDAGADNSKSLTYYIACIARCFFMGRRPTARLANTPPAPRPLALRRAPRCRSPPDCALSEPDCPLVPTVATAIGSPWRGAWPPPPNFYRIHDDLESLFEKN